MKTAIVIGAGATGKAAALALAPVAERIFLYDRVAKSGMAGGALMMWSNAVKALGCLGISRDELMDPTTVAMAPTTVAMQRMDFRTWEGDLLWSMAINALSDRAGAPSLLVDREVLQNVLQRRVDALGAKKVVQTTDKTFWNFTLTDANVTAVFTDGDDVTGDLLLGAEGAMSTVRKRLLGPPRYRKTGQYVVFGYSTVPSRIAPAGASYCLMDAKHRFFAAGLRAGGRGWQRSYWGASVPTSLADESRKGVATTSNRPFTLDQLREAFRGAAPDVDAILAGSEDVKGAARWWATESRDVPPGGAWHRGRVGLLGDAAHLMTYDLGQGQAMGFEDAVVLRRCATRHPDAPAAALAALENSRRYRVGVITELSYRAAQISTPGSELLSWLRDLATANVYAPINERTMRYMLEVDLGEDEQANGATNPDERLGDEPADGSSP